MKLLRTIVMLSAVTLAMIPGTSDATTTSLTWSAAKTVTLPSGGTGIPQGYLPALSCPSARNCTAAGAFSDAAGNTQGLVLDEVNGVWRPSRMLRAPADAAKNPNVTVNALSCASAGNCAVVGNYQDKVGDSRSFVADEVRRTWQPARDVVLASDARTTGQNSAVHAVSCSSDGNCSAVGTYLDSTSPLGHVLGFSLNEVRGVWQRARPITLPANANLNAFVSLVQLVCTSNANCVAVGSYIDTNNVTRGLVVQEVNAVWRPGRSVTLPGDANEFPSASLREIACASTNNCTAIGTYVNAAGSLVGLSVTEAGGVWQRAVEMVMPYGAADNPRVFFYGFDGISCPSVGNCSAGGQYLDSAGFYQGFFIDEVAATWRVATQLALPSGAQSAGQNGGVVAISCRRAGACHAGAAYLDGAGNYQALFVNEEGGVWRTGTRVVLPGGATTVGVDGGVYGLVCSSVSACTATGSYQSSATNYQGFTVVTR